MSFLTSIGVLGGYSISLSETESIVLRVILVVGLLCLIIYKLWMAVAEHISSLNRQIKYHQETAEQYRRMYRELLAWKTPGNMDWKPWEPIRKPEIISRQQRLIKKLRKLVRSSTNPHEISNAKTRLQELQERK